MSRFQSLTPLLLVLILSACTVGPDYTPPQIDPPDRFVLQDVLNTLNEDSQTTIVVAQWWKGFSDPTLNQLIEQALENNLRIAGAGARLREARALRDFAAARDNPSIVADAEGTIEQERLLQPEETESTAKSLLGAISLVWPLDVFGRTRRSVESAEAGIEIAESALRGLILETSSEVALEYLRLRGNQRQLELLEESVALQEQTLAIVRSRFEAGLAPELDLRRAETSVERLRADLAPLKESLINARNRLAILSGRYPGVYEETLREREDIPRYVARIADPLPLEVLMRRPDLQQAEARLKQTIAQIGVAEAQYYPTFDLASQIFLSSSVVEEGPTVDLLVSSLSLLIEQVIYDGGARDANLEAAQARAEAALFDYRQALLEATQEVESALAAIDSSRASQVSLEKAVNSSSRSFQQAEMLYQQGLISFLDVVDAQRVLADAEQRLAAERTNYATRIATLFRVLGTPIHNGPVPETAEKPPLEN